MPDTLSPTPYPDVNALIHELSASMRPILADHFLAMYLDGSLASGAFDADSDVDFIVVTKDDVTPSGWRGCCDLARSRRCGCLGRKRRRRVIWFALVRTPAVI